MYPWQAVKANPQLIQRYLVKQEVLRATRAFFESQGYNELESPILSPALPSERYLNFLSVNLGNKEAYLIPSTERYNKIALAAGIGNHFVITKVFRGAEQMSPNHRPEFTMLEWYTMGANYFGLMDQTESLIKKIINRLKGDKEDFKVTYQGQEIDFGKKWNRFSVNELLQKSINKSLPDLQTWQQIKDVCVELHLLQNAGATESEVSWQDLFDLIFMNRIEENLERNVPTFIYDYPKIMAPLAKPNDDGLTAQKVELYIAGKEIANGYTELLDADVLETNLRAEYSARKQLGLPLAKFDDELIAAVRSGIDPVAGIGMGLDRLTMILADAGSLSDISLFSL